MLWLARLVCLRLVVADSRDGVYTTTDRAREFSMNVSRFAGVLVQRLAYRGRRISVHLMRHSFAHDADIL
jgi:hypothetical protein